MKKLIIIALISTLVFSATNSFAQEVELEAKVRIMDPLSILPTRIIHFGSINLTGQNGEDCLLKISPLGRRSINCGSDRTDHMLLHSNNGSAGFILIHGSKNTRITMSGIANSCSEPKLSMQDFEFLHSRTNSIGYLINQHGATLKILPNVIGGRHTCTYTISANY